MCRKCVPVFEHGIAMPLHGVALENVQEPHKHTAFNVGQQCACYLHNWVIKKSIHSQNRSFKIRPIKLICSLKIV